MSHIPWERCPILLDIPLLHFSLLGTFLRCRYSWALPVLGHMTAFNITGCRVRLPFVCSITAQYSPSGRTGGADLMGVAVLLLMVAAWFDMSSCLWRLHVQVLYLCTCGSVGFYFAFTCAVGGIGSVSYVWGACWVGLLGGFTLGGGSGEAFELSTLRYFIGLFFSCGTAFGGSKYCGVAFMLKIVAVFFRDMVCLLPSVVRFLVGVGLSNACVGSVVHVFPHPLNTSLVMGGFLSNNSVVLENLYLAVLEMFYVRQR